MENLGYPNKLEALYQSDPEAFRSIFDESYPEIEANPVAGVWKARLDFKTEKQEKPRFDLIDIIKLVVVCAFAGFFAKFPKIFGIEQPEIYYARNIGLIIFGGVGAYFLSSNSNKAKHIFMAIGIFAVLVLYMNVTPFSHSSHTIKLMIAHLPLLLWSGLGIVKIKFESSNLAKRLDYIKFNGELLIISAVILISGAILTAISIQLFFAIGIQIEQFYAENIVLIGAVSTPIVASYIITKFPHIADRIAPIIAKIFTPLVLITLVIFLISIPASGKDLFKDREFLLIFNLLLIGVMAVIVFSIAESSGSSVQKFHKMSLLALAIATLVVDIFAVSAIFYRFGEYGISPNRIAVVGSNLLIFVNLTWITWDLINVNFKKVHISRVEMSVARYLPAYTAWSIFMVFILPLIYQYN